MQVRPILALLLCGMLFACAVPTREESPLMERAKRLEAHGAYAEAADLYLDLAARASSPEKERLRLEAARAYLKAGRKAKALGILRAIPSKTPDIRRGRDTLLARLALIEGRPGEALALLDALPPDAGTLALRAEALEMLGKTREALETRMALQVRLRDPEAQRQNETALWKGLLALSPEELAAWREANRDPAVEGWLALASIAERHRLDRPSLIEAMTRWRQGHPRHPAHEAFLLAVLKASEVPLGFPEGKPEIVAVILPLSGPLAAAGEAVEHGLLAAYYGGGEKPVLRFYDNPEPPKTREVYQQALEEGAQAVIGPLAKASVSELLKAASLPVPTLALNQGQGNPPPRLILFGLFPEDEARQVAQKAFDDGRRRALSLAPEGEWGERVQSAFKAAFESLGGEVLEEQAFGAEPEAIHRAVRRLLDIDRSEARFRALRKLLKRKIAFEPSRRRDADMVFLAAPPQAAREVLPLLRFYFAGDLPVYSTSHALPLRWSPEAGEDLAGLILCDMPWVLDAPEDPFKAALSALFPERFPPYRRLYALGIDALNALFALPRLASQPLPGRTGTLSLKGGRIERTLMCTRLTPEGPAHAL